jgi:carboxypeptidase T
MSKRKLILLTLFAVLVIPAVLIKQAISVDSSWYWVKLKAPTSFERSIIANTGTSIEGVRDGYVYGFANTEELEKLKKLGWLEQYHAMTQELDFPAEDSRYHNYGELQAALTQIVQKNPSIVKKITLGKSVEGRELAGLEISGNLKNKTSLPGIFFMGGHHAREHLSVEVPLMLANYLVTEYTNNNPLIKNLIDNRVVTIVPAINPDGLEYDISSGTYRYWRKNRAQNRLGSSGVDLNRNYGYQWGTGGSSSNEFSDVYMGPAPFSEPETRAVKNYIDTHDNITVLLSFHTFSQLILYPWGHSYSAISKEKDLRAFQAMATKMSQWNGYTPQQSSELYIASGDTTDWSYAAHGIFSFTFELDPANNGFNPGGFYPGDEIIEQVFQKNIKPALYLIGLADNPYRAAETQWIDPL